MALRGVTNNPFNLLSDAAPAEPASKPAVAAKPAAAAAKPAAPTAAAGKGAAKPSAPAAAPAKAAPKPSAGRPHKAAATTAHAGGSAVADGAAARSDRPPKKFHDRPPRAARGDKEAAYTAGKARIYDKPSHSGTGRPPTENKKGGGGAHNWGKPGSELADALADAKPEDGEVAAVALSEEKEKAPERPLTEEELAAKAEAEKEARQITMEEYLAKQKKFNLALPPVRKANEGIEIEGKDEWNAYQKVVRDDLPSGAAGKKAAAKKADGKTKEEKPAVDPKSLLGFRSPPPANSDRGGDRRGGRGGGRGGGSTRGGGGAGGGASHHHHGGASASAPAKDASFDKSAFPALPSHGSPAAAPATAAAATPVAASAAAAAAPASSAPTASAPAPAPAPAAPAPVASKP